MFELPTMRLPRNAWLLNCCVSPQSEIARVRVDRSLIGAPSDFRHIGHLGAGDLHSAANNQENAFGALLRSKGGPEFAMAIPPGIREADVPIGGNGQMEEKRKTTKGEADGGMEVDGMVDEDGEERGRMMKQGMAMDERRGKGAS